MTGPSRLDADDISTSGTQAIPPLPTAKPFRSTNVSARIDLVSEAKAFGINLSEVFESALESAVREAQRKQWVEENRQAFAAYDKFVETHGIFSEGKRLF
jgi:antitoxin CcdA